MTTQKIVNLIFLDIGIIVVGDFGREISARCGQMFVLLELVVSVVNVLHLVSVFSSEQVQISHPNLVYLACCNEGGVPSGTSPT